MSPFWKGILWRQFGAAIETLRNALNACPDGLWQAPLWNESESHPEFGEYWYVVYHTIFWLDYYCSHSAESFKVPAPFTVTEPEMDAVLPERVYTRQELQTYLEYARDKCRARIAGLNDENEPQRIRNDWDLKTVAEVMLYTMRHVQEHAAQLNMLLGQKTGSAPGWVGRVTT